MKNIRNFCIIAHIDHGKSTLADRFLEFTHLVADRDMQEQFLDSNPISRERGITIKLAPVRMKYKYQEEDYFLNLIDTPGHVDFSYEVSRALAACEGAILLVDATVGIQAQTLTVYRQAKAQNLKIIPVLNKIDNPDARVEDVTLDLCESFGFEPNEVLAISAKTGLGVGKVLEAVIERLPAPNTENVDDELKALVFDSHFDQHVGVVADVRLFSGAIRENDRCRLIAGGRNFQTLQVGVYAPKETSTQILSSGEVGYIHTGLKSLQEVKVGDTITLFSQKETKALSGYKEPKPMVFLGLYPVDNNDYPDLSEALEKLHLNDSSFSYSPEFSASLGKGFRIGFAGLLHAEIVKERLEREFDLALIVSVPQVLFQYELNGEIQDVHTARELPDQVNKVFEPWLNVVVFSPKDYLGSVMDLFEKRRGLYKNMQYLSDGVQLFYDLPMAELVTDFFDRLKSITSGYASLDYEFSDMREVDAVRLDILIHGERVDALSQIVVKTEAYNIGKRVVKKLKEAIPRQMFEVAVQAAVGGQIVARETIKAFRKDVTAKLYGGDVTRRLKLLEKQKKGKKRMKQFGKVSIPQEAFMAVVKREE
ncbi:elongation factor 4 [Candidatus Beckwithbacteria bacterium]|nr:elongation factor 4 [Candidatus Beckwithbacteria bacterium]